VQRSATVTAIDLGDAVESEDVWHRGVG